MKKFRSLMLLMFLCLAVALVPGTRTVSVEAASVKSGLKKESGKYYYYTSGKKVTNVWKTVKGKKYYFGSTGAAYAGTKTKPAVKKINGAYYAFNEKARRVSGDCVINNKLYRFAKNGKYDAAGTQKLRNECVYMKDASKLIELLGKPKKRQELDGCYGGMKDIVYHYEYFVVNVSQDANGKEFFLGVLTK